MNISRHSKNGQLNPSLWPNLSIRKWRINENKLYCQFNIVTDREFKGRSYLQTTASVFPVFLYTKMQFIQQYYDEGIAMVTKLMVVKNVKETYKVCFW